jgi:hypothetical protein
LVLHYCMMTSAATCFNFNGNNNAKYIIQGINSSGAPLRIELGNTHRVLWNDQNKANANS